MKIMIDNLKETMLKMMDEMSNRIDCPISKEFNELAMMSPENMEIALEIVNNRFWTHQRDCKYPISAYTRPWVADKKITYIGDIMVYAKSYYTPFGCGEPYIMHVFDVHGVMKPCTHVDDNMHPVTAGCAYESMPEIYEWIQ